MAQLSITLPTRAGHKQAGPGGIPYEVRYQPEESPFAFVLRFYEIEHDDGTRELLCVDTAVEQRKDAGANTSEPITAPVVRDLANRWERLEQGARVALAQAIGFDLGDEAPRHFTAGSVRTRRELSPEFLADIVQRHNHYRAQGSSPTQALAREKGVSPSTVKNWIRKAQQAGITDEQA